MTPAGTAAICCLSCINWEILASTSCGMHVESASGSCVKGCTCTCKGTTRAGGVPVLESVSGVFCLVNWVGPEAGVRAIGVSIRAGIGLGLGSVARVRGLGEGSCGSSVKSMLIGLGLSSFSGSGS